MLACTAPTLGGCSFVFSSGPSSDAVRSPLSAPVDCSTSKVPPVLDTIITGFQVARTGLAASAEDKVYRDSSLSREADIGIGIGLTALFLGSAIYGYHATSMCTKVNSPEQPDTAMDTTGNRLWTPKPPDRRRSPAAPVGAVGFAFGASKKEAAAVCRQAGLEWSDEEGAARCSGTPSEGVPGASTQLDFADGRLSAVELVIHPPDDAQGWAKAFRDTEATLIRLFGKPEQHNFVVPDECKDAALFLGCVADGKVPGSASWSLDGGRFAALSIAGSPSPSPSTIRVRLTPERPKT